MVQRKRKHAAADLLTTTASRTQLSIAAFTKVTKTRQEDESAKKRKTVHDHVDPPVPQLCTYSPNNKRKRSEAQQIDTSSKDERNLQASAAETPDPPSTPRSKRCKTATAQVPDTPSRAAATLFDKLDLDAKRPELSSQWPDELEEIKELYSAFLAALSLHYSHNGTASPVNMKALLPVITGHWKKRSATLDDLCRILALQPVGRHMFALEDFGRAGICLTRASAQSLVLQRTATYIDEPKLNASFAECLEQRWRAFQRTTDKENRTADAFLAQITPAEITANASAQKAAPLFARGQQRLADLKAARTDITASPDVAGAATSRPSLAMKATPAALQNRSTALLDRVLAKQSHLASLPAGPDKAALERKAALQRVEDVARILMLLSGANNRDRCSYSLPVLTQSIQQSLRTALSREEIERCLELLAVELTPDFIRVIRTGAVCGIVVTRSAAVNVAELRTRVQEASTR